MAASAYSTAAIRAESPSAGAPAVKAAYQGMPSTRPMMAPSSASDTVFSATCDAATAVMPWGAANQMAGKRIAICMIPVAVSSHERPSALKTAPGMLASEASAAQTATKARGAAAARHFSP